MERRHCASGRLPFSALIPATRRVSETLGRDFQHSECPFRVRSVAVAVRRSLPIYPRLQTWRCDAITDAKGHVWTAPGWQEESSLCSIGRSSHVFGLLARFKIGRAHV